MVACGPGTAEADQDLNGPGKRDVLPCRPLVGCDLGSGRGDPGGGVNHRARPKPSASGLGIPGWCLFHAGVGGVAIPITWKFATPAPAGPPRGGLGEIRQGRRTFLAALPKRISRQSRFSGNGISKLIAEKQLRRLYLRLSFGLCHIRPSGPDPGRGDGLRPRLAGDRPQPTQPRQQGIRSFGGPTRGGDSGGFRTGGGFGGWGFRTRGGF
jgi:hypothetical protein